MAFNLHTPISITTKSADRDKPFALDDKQQDWEYIARLYEEYKQAKNKEFWAYRSVDLAAICQFAPYALIHGVIQKSQGLYGRGKMTGLDIQHLLRNWSYKSVPETFVDVSQTISKTHNWSLTWITRRHEEWIAMLGQDLSGKVKFHKETPTEVCNRLKNYILADSSIILLADKRVSIQQVDKLIYYLPPDNKINSICSNSRNLLGNTGRLEFRAPSRMRQQVVQMRDNHVFMHPVLYETWYSSGITSLGYPSTASNPDETISKTKDIKSSKVDSIGEWIHQTPGLRHKTQADNCHHCAQPKKNQFDYYDRLCWDCGLRAWQIRHKQADLSPVRMCITGCRHTVGWTTSLRALRQGAFVLGTTRFPNLALAAYKLEPDYPEWRDRLVVLGADFTRYPDIQTVISALTEYRINCYVNNAFQTMPNTHEYLETARKLELTPPSDSESLRQVLDVNGNIRPMALTNWNSMDEPAIKKDTNPSTPSQELVVIQHRFGTGNSWKQPIHKIAPEEIITAGMVNQIAPSLIISAFRQMSVAANKKTPDNSLGWPFQVIINVGSSEGDAGVQASITGGHKNHMRKMIECLRAEKDSHLLAYTSDPGFITGVFGKSEPANPSTGLIKVLTADDGGARVLWPLIDFVNSGKHPDEYYRG